MTQSRGSWDIATCRVFSCGRARLTQVIANFMRSEDLNVGIDAYTDDTHEGPSGNGIYVIDGWQIVERIGCHGEQREYLLDKMLLSIDGA